MRFNAHKLLLDPYARAVSGEFGSDPAVFGFVKREDGKDDLAVRDERDSAPYVGRSVVVHDTFDWGDDQKIGARWRDSVVYELHVKGFTQLHDRIPEELRGTYAGLGHPVVIDYLRDLGVTAVELLPVHMFVSEPRLAAYGLKNYWGYNSLAYFAPDAAYCSPATAASRSPSSSRWSRTSTRPASRCSSTSSTTTPPRRASTDRRCPSAGSTTPASTSGSRPTRRTAGSRPPTGTSPGAATRWTPRTRRRCG